MVFPATFSSSRRRHAGTVLAILLLLALPVRAQVNDPKFSDYFLVGRFGEVCTMCEVMVLCQAGNKAPTHDHVPAHGSFTLYYIQTRTFWSQLSTIWDWFVASFSSRPLVSGHDRPVITYTVAAGMWSPPIAGNMHISLDPPVLVMPDGRDIDRITRRWRNTRLPHRLGYCERLPLWDAIKVIDRQAAGGNP